MSEAKDMKIAITGASGLIGRALSTRAEERGWTVMPMVRDRDRSGIYWSAQEQEIDAEGLEGVDAVVHLAGENLSEGRWTAPQKKRILESRTKGTELIAKTIASLDDGPSVFICASGVNYYGSGHGDEWIDEGHEAGTGFLAEVCQAWEDACEPARAAGIRVINARFGVALSKEGGALAKMLTPFKWGVGGRLGSGEQYFSWIAVDDLTGALVFLLESTDLDGPFNVAAPEPVKNKVLTRALGKALGRPTFFPVPGPLLKLVVGAQMAEEAILNGLRVCPKRLLEAGFEFEYRTIDQGLEAALGQGDSQ